MEDGLNIFTKIVPERTAVRGPAALRKRKYFLVFPWMYTIIIKGKIMLKKYIPKSAIKKLIPSVSWSKVLQEWQIPSQKEAMRTTKEKTCRS